MILLPIHPEFVAKIRSGEKRFEFRTRVPAALNDDPLVLVYATAPVRAIVGYFRVGSVLALSPTAMWRATKAEAGISRARFSVYFRGRPTAYAMEIAEFRAFVRPCSLEALRGTPAPPQSFTMLTSDQRRRILRRVTVKGQPHA